MTRAGAPGRRAALARRRAGRRAQGRTPRDERSAALAARPRRLRIAAARHARRAEEARRLEDLRGRAGAERAPARGRARRFRRQGRDHQRAARPGRHALRARARAGHQVVARHRPRRRHRALDVGDLGARRRRPGAQRHRHRTAQPAARDGLLARTAGEPGFREVQAPPRHRARQDDRRRAGDRRPRAHAASAGRRHHRLGQVGGDQHHGDEPALSPEARAMPADHGRSEDARALRLRRHSRICSPPSSPIPRRRWWR